MEANSISWERYEEHIRAMKMSWDNFPRKEVLDQQYVQNIDLLLFCLFDTVSTNEPSAAAEYQLQMLLRAVVVAFRKLVA